MDEKYTGIGFMAQSSNIPHHLQNTLNTSIKITGNGLISPMHYILNAAILLYPPHYYRAI